MSKVLKSLVKTGASQLIENQLPRRAAARATPQSRTALRRAAPTPRGGLDRQEGLPLAQRPCPFSAGPGFEK